MDGPSFVPVDENGVEGVYSVEVANREHPLTDQGCGSIEMGPRC